VGIESGLTVGAVGEQVGELHRALTVMGFDIDDEERRDRRFGVSTGAALRRLQAVAGVPQTGELGADTAAVIEAALSRLTANAGADGATPGMYLVGGTVTNVDGEPLSKTTVVAFDRDLRDSRQLGQGVTDGGGRYQISYSPADLSPGRASADLRVDVRNDKVTLFSSPVLFNAPPQATIDLALGGPAHAQPSEYSAVFAAVAPLLGALTPLQVQEDSNHQDLTFLAGQTGIARERLALWAVAQRLAAGTQLPAELFYALFRSGVPADAAATALAASAHGIDLHANARRLLDEVLAAAPAGLQAPVSAAVQANIVPASYGQRAAKDLAKLGKLSTQATLGSALGSVLDALSLGQSAKERFVRRYGAAVGPARATFWSDLAKDKSFTAAQVEDLRFGLTVAQLSSGHLPLIRELAAQRAAGKFTSAGDLARWTAADWVALLTRTPDGGKPIGTPPSPGAATPDAYAAMLERSFTQAFPTTAFSARVAADPATPFGNAAATAAFLDANPGLDLRYTNIDAFTQNTDIEPGVRATLLAAQRLIKLTPNYGVMHALHADGVHSAQQIYAMGRDTFAAKYAQLPALGGGEAAGMWARAEQTYAMALALGTKFNATLSATSPAAVPHVLPDDVSQQIAAFPNLQTLFGSDSMCACQECQSVLGAGAYLVDMLEFLSHRAADSGSVRDVLLARRPDLAQIELSCPNTNTELPYIDLVNELLEDAAAPPPDPAAAARARQTTLETPELNANPEHVNAQAYARLAAAVYPWTLPFDLELAEARTYLGALDLSRAQLSRTFEKPAGYPSPQAQQLAREQLGLSALEADIVTGGPLAAGFRSWDYWGLAENGNSITDPADPAATITGGWIDVLGHVRVLLGRAGLDNAELSRLLNTNFVNGDGAVSISTDPPGSCDIATMTITGLSQDTLDRLHRFVRLQRRLGWEAYDLDDAIASLQAGAPAGLARLNDLLLRQLAAVTAAVGRYSFSAAEAVALFAAIETRDVPTLPGDDPRYSLYDDLFANLTVLNPPDSAFALDAHGNLIAAASTPPAVLAQHRPALVAAFELGDADLELAIGTLTDGLLTLPNLAALYRSARLARALGVTIRELITLLAIAEAPIDASPGYEVVAPFDGTRPEALATFTGLLAELKDSGFTVAQADYLVRGVDDGTVAPDPVAVGTMLLGLYTGLGKISAENAFAPDPTGAATRKQLERLLAASDVDTAMAILDGSTALSAADQAAFIAMTLAPYLPASAQTELVGATALAAGQPRFDYVLHSVLAYQIRTQSSGLVMHTLAQSLGLTTATTALLLSEWLPSFTGTGELIDDFLTLTSANVIDPQAPISPDEPGFAPYFNAYATLAKIALIVTTLRLSSDDVGWWHSNGVAAGWLDPETLPSAPQPTAAGRFHSLLRLARARTVRDGVPPGNASFAMLFTAGITKSDYFARLGALTQWPPATLTVLCGDPASNTDQGELSLAYPGDYQSEAALSRLLPALEILTKTGIPADVSGWITPTLGPGTGDTIKQSVKANHPEQEWVALAKQLRDPLREAQRDALVSYLIANPPPNVGPWLGPEEVFAHFLIDVEMGACMATSRIVQANAAIQLFAQRCFLGLEPGIVVDTATDSSWSQWQWMSRYRVWQANREIFLFPENWIDPGLRSDSSPFFADLENDLRQGDLDAELATTALANYLEKLETVARLDVCGIFHDYENFNNVLYVLARTQGTPHVYYMRRWVGSSRWTPWEKVDLDIASDHIVPVVWDGRPYLFWLVVTSKPDELGQATPAQPDQNQPLPPPSKHLEVQLAWSQYKHGKWQAKQTAPQTLAFSKLLGLPDLNAWDLTLKSSFNGPVLELDVFLADKAGQSEPRMHFGGYQLRGAGTGVEAYLAYPFLNGLPQVGGEAARDVGALAPPMSKPPLTAPGVFDGDWFAPVGTAFLSATRPRVASVAVSYASLPLLEQADSFRLVVPHQTPSFDSSLPFFYRDSGRSYLAVPSGYYRHRLHVVIGPGVVIDPPLSFNGPPTSADTAFRSFYHPFVPLLVRALNAGGTDALYDRALQHDPATAAGTAPFDFANYYQPTAAVLTPYPAESIEFARDSSNSGDNWEIFVHAPFQIANALSTNQQFDDARRWYEYIFNPHGTSTDPAPQRYWVTEPFFEMSQPDYAAQQISTLMQEINAHDPQLENQVAAWRADPFDPDMIAQLRPVAYQRAIVAKYIDNLIAAGDQLFRQDTRESVNLATQYYLLASELLGPRPELVPPRVEPVIKTYAELEGALDAFSNELVAAENVIPPVNADVPTPVSTPSLPTLTTLYFCIPANSTLLGYWDLVADRLFKIRRCMNIEGVVQQLALFAPPLSPGSLVAAAAAGLDLDSVLTDLGAAVPPYRFRLILRHALELCDQVRGHGAELLAALEKRDAEALARIRSASERQLQAAVAEARSRQVDAANQDLSVLAASKQNALDRLSFYASRPLMNLWELAAQVLRMGALIPQAIASDLELTASTAHLAPTYQTGVAGSFSSPVATVMGGGDQAGAAASAGAAQARMVAAIMQTSAELSATLGQYYQRQDEWNLQATLARDDIARIDTETAAATIRLDVAEREKAAQDLSVQQADDLDAFLHSKFTNQELYDWMVGQTSTTYFEAYQLAYAMAKAAEQCYQRELAIPDTGFITFGYWDSLKQGLTAGDKLQDDLRRLESAYYTNNERELELSKHVSLLQLDPYALVELRTSGSCLVQLPELLFDLDNPGHYLRRLKSVAVTLPCVVGPYTSVSLTLTLLDNHIRTSNEIGGGYPRAGTGDARFTDYPGGVEQIVTSSGQNDDGLFELHLDDERYLPFENAGAISTWRLTLNNVYPQFDYSTISDVVLHLRYTARHGGSPFAAAVAASAKAQLNAVALAENRKGLYRLFSARRDFAANWEMFLSPAPGADQVLTLPLPPERFPFYTNGLDIQADGIDVIATAGTTSTYDLELTTPGGTVRPATLTPEPALGGAHHAHLALTPALNLGRAPTPVSTTPSTFSLKLRQSGTGDWRSLNPSDVNDILLVLSYHVTQ
jgi:Tc toxin complex TcA C-terminal TcB-binding domain/Neuraminidase-like domain/Putative peptidoglycan binding domain